MGQTAGRVEGGVEGDDFDAGRSCFFAGGLEGVDVIGGDGDGGDLLADQFVDHGDLVFGSRIGRTLDDHFAAEFFNSLGESFGFFFVVGIAGVLDDQGIGAGVASGRGSGGFTSGRGSSCGSRGGSCGSPRGATSQQGDHQGQ